MRFTFLLFLFLLTGCPNNKSSAEPSKYMSKEAIIQEYLYYKNNTLSVENEPLTEEQINRANYLPSAKQLTKDLPRIRNFQETNAIKNDVDLRNRDTSIKDQGQYGYCTAYGSIAALENTINKTGSVANLDLSEWHLWSLYKQPSATAVLKAITNNYICDEKYFPTGGKQSTKCTPTAHAKLISYQTAGYNNIAAIQEALNRGNVLTIATIVPSSIMRCKAVVNPNSGFETTGHEMMIVGIINDARLEAPLLILKNSWKSSCHDNGYAYFPFELCTKQGGGCWAWEYIKVENK